MVGRRHRQRIVRMTLERAEAGGVCRHKFMNGVVEAPGPIESVIAAPAVHAAQVMDDVAASDDEDATVAERCQPCTKL
jgi:hypothetical protein